MLWSFVYLAVRNLFALVWLLARSRRSKELEILVLRHELAVLRRQRSRPRLTRGDRALFAAVSRSLPRRAWTSFLVKPETVLGWHRQLVARRWAYPNRTPGRPPLERSLRRLILRVAREIDGHDLRSVKLESLRSQLGVVPQEPFLFAGSIRDNIAFGRPDSTDEEVMQAVEAVGLTELVEQLPEGIHSYVHERGATLSAGERQLLALARTFLYQPRVVVLDEATSNLDLQSETRVERALDRLLEGRTTIIIAHRLSTAMRADRIAGVDDGRMVELGSRDELIELAGHYAEMYATWLSHSQPTPRAA